jgi:hypothetical protein
MTRVGADALGSCGGKIGVEGREPFKTALSSDLETAAELLGFAR